VVTRPRRELAERVGGPLQQSFLAHDGAAQADQHQRLARLTCPPLAGTFARRRAYLRADHLGRASSTTQD
jgi:hypothetical protein